MPCAMFCSITVLPVRGAATMSPRCPFPMGVSRSMMRVVNSSGSCSSTQVLVRVERRQVVEEDLVARALGLLVVDRLDLEQREVALAFLRRADLAGDDVAGAQVEAADLARRDVDVVRARAGSCSRARAGSRSRRAGSRARPRRRRGRSARSAPAGWRRSAPACASPPRLRCCASLASGGELADLLVLQRLQVERRRLLGGRLRRRPRARP